LYLFFIGIDRFIGPIQLCVLPHKRKYAEKKPIAEKRKEVDLDRWGWLRRIRGSVGASKKGSGGD
jgi:hypothetical protein